jgi:hypothetical protein
LRKPSEKLMVILLNNLGEVISIGITLLYRSI